MACEICKKPRIPDETLNSDNKPNVCNLCGKGFSLKIQLKRHILSHKTDVPYICNTCEKHLEPSSYNLRLFEKGNYSCDTCDKNFPTKRLLLRHATEHTLEAALKCDECGESFKNMTALKKHAAVHKAKKMPSKEKAKVSYICMDCGKKFLKFKAFEKHQLTHKYKCDDCDARFTSNKLLNEHKNEHCKSKILGNSQLDNNNSLDSDEKKHVCNICNKTFTRKSALEGHVASHLSEEHDSPVEDDSDIDTDFKCNYKDDKPNEEVKQKCLPKLKIRRSFPCDKCDVVYVSKKSYDKHMAAHETIPEPIIEPVIENTKIYTCRICNETFKVKEDYKKHKQLHDKKEAEQNNGNKVKRTYTCQICENVFCKKRHLRRHLKKHFNVNDPDETSSLSSEDILLGKRPNGAKRDKSYACNFCGKLFAGETCWKKHEARHLEEEEDGGDSANKEKKNKKLPKNLICDFCNEDFSGKKQHFLRHKQSHTPEVCGICDARFVDRAALREHCRIHIGTEEGRRFLECSQKALDAKNGVAPPEPKVEYIYLVLR